MDVIEVRDGFIKFTADSTICLSSFVKIRGENKSYIAQVIQLKQEDYLVAYAKILFLLVDGMLANYDMTSPSEDAEIDNFTSEILCNSIPVENPIIVGKSFEQDLNITIDAAAFDKKMLICTDSVKCNNIVIENLSKQFKNLDKNLITIDMSGIYNFPKFIPGKDFKLPLDTNSLQFIYEDCLNDATPDSKALIVEIFKDLSEYSKTVPFVPLKTLTTVVADMVDNSHVFKLLALKNKLIKLEKMGYFAENAKESFRLKEIIKSGNANFDLSKLDAAFQNRFIKFIYDSIEDDNVQVFIEMSNSISKKCIKHIFSNEKIATTFIAHSNFKYLNDIKNIFDNFIVEPSKINNNTFEIYSAFLNTMQENSFLIAGEATNYIPLVSQLVEINDIPLLEKDLGFDDESTDEKDSEQTNSGDEQSLNESFEEESESLHAELESEPDNSNKISDEISEEVDLDDTQENIPFETTVHTSELIASIDEHSENVMESVAETLEEPEHIDMFGDSEENSNAEQNKTEPVDEDELDTELQKEEILQNQDAETGYNTGNEVTDDNVSSINTDGLPETDPEPFEEETKENIDNFENNDTEDVLLSELETEPETIQEQDVEELTFKDDSDFDEEGDSVITDELNPEDEFIRDESFSIEDNEEVINEPEETSIVLDDGFDLDIENVNPPETDESNIAESQEPKPEEIAENEQDVIPAGDDDSAFDEIVELDSEEIDANDIIVDIEDSYEEEMSDDAENRIVKDVDKVFTTRKDEEITDSDLDFIDELNNNENNDSLVEIPDSDTALEEIPQDNSSDTIEEISYYDNQEEQIINSEILEKRDASTPIVPVYEADIPEEDMVTSDPIQQGDSVYHAKFGNGVVEKMIKYGNKTLYAINFDNIGRRLLDPTLTEIKKS
ncbi:hypothetical protein IJ750_07755 [bacterium]|nr:hypothetical protein [bacterium]